MARFNASDAARTVAGLMRTLGEPRVSIGSAAGSTSEVRLTVAWELGWYQWGVDLADEMRTVFQLGKGDEIDQLDGSARQWNARAGEGGRLALGVSPAGSCAIAASGVGVIGARSGPAAGACEWWVIGTWQQASTSGIDVEDTRRVRPGVSTTVTHRRAVGTGTRSRPPAGLHDVIAQP